MCTSEDRIQTDSRVKKTLLNARVNLLFYFISLFLSFFSRKIFLDCLGADFVGLTGTLGNILGYLNLAELGVSAAVGFNLYKPIQQRNKDEINDIVSLYGYYYRNIGLAVLAGGILISIFIPVIFSASDFPLGVIFFAFYSFLVSSLIGYFLNYRSILLSADQKNYVIAAYSQTANLIKTILQLSLAYYYANYYIWIAIELFFGIIYCFILNYKINRVYPWLKCSVTEGKKRSADYPNILKSTRQIFIHKIKDFLLTQSDQLFIFIFVSLKMVAYYGNYVLIIGRVMSLLGTVLDSVLASVGNLVAENDRPKILRIFWELMALRYFMAGTICFCIFHLINPFITLWLGAQYVLSDIILIILLINLFIMISRGTVDNFNFAYGHYGDIWAAWTEGIINIVVTIVLGYCWGIPGILAGKTISMIPIIIFWKPLYLFRDGFRESYRYYWKNTLRYYVFFWVAAVGTHVILKVLPVDPFVSFGWWTVYAVICTALFGSSYLTLIIFYAAGGKNLISRLPFKKMSKDCNYG